MAERTGIAWTDHTFNLIWGCSRVSPACDFCYAETLSNRFGFDLWGDDKPRRIFGDKHWNDPIRWNRKAQEEARQHRVFSSSMGDVFEDHPDLPDQRDRLWNLISLTPWLTWQLLTKRPQNVPKMVPYNGNWPKNVWLGVTTENANYARMRIRQLNQVPARIRFLSVEPMLGPLKGVDLSGIHWVIIGGESGVHARYTDPEWIRGLIEQCSEKNIACFVKQAGLVLGKEWGCPDNHGADVDFWPDWAKIRQFPNEKEPQNT